MCTLDNRSRNPDVLMPPVIGDGDLNPFPQLIPPVPQPSYGSGSLVGPNHPIFGILYALPFLLY